jgi:hypothetical protein
MSDFAEQLQEEKFELWTRMTKLGKFLETGDFGAIEDVEVNLLREQYAAMVRYYSTLNLRCYRHQTGAWPAMMVNTLGLDNANKLS